MKYLILSIFYRTDIVLGDLNISFVDQNNKNYFDKFDSNIFSSYVKIGLLLHLSKNYNTSNINKVKIINNPKSKISIKKIYYIIPKNKKQNAFNYIKYSFKILLK